MTRLLHLSLSPTFTVGDPPPTGYNAWHEWADIQRKHGLRQAKCGRCVKWKFPQEFSSVVDVSEATTKKHGGRKVAIKSPVCLVCLALSGESK